MDEQNIKAFLLFLRLYRNLTLELGGNNQVVSNTMPCWNEFKEWVEATIIGHLSGARVKQLFTLLFAQYAEHIVVNEWGDNWTRSLVIGSWTFEVNIPYDLTNRVSYTILDIDWKKAGDPVLYTHRTTLPFEKEDNLTRTL